MPQVCASCGEKLLLSKSSFQEYTLVRGGKLVSWWWHTRCPAPWEKIHPRK